jgi:hypothetical protein
MITPRVAIAAEMQAVQWGAAPFVFKGADFDVDFGI